MEDIDKDLESLFDDPILNIDNDQLSIFDVPNYLAKTKDKADADFVAQREKCEDFHLFEYGFKKVHNELNSGKRSLSKYSAQALKEGTYYIVGGMLAYLDKIFETKIVPNSHRQIDGRTRTIYENGTESNILLRTLAKAIYSDGYVITESLETNNLAFQNSFTLKEDDIQDGWIYVLRSLSKEPSVTKQKNLYKIGFSTIPVTERIKNCENEPTYFMDKVEIIATWKTYNLKTHELETIIHKFFSNSSFHLKVQDQFGQIYTPKEWFVVPLSIIQAVIEKIIDGTIIKYYYNRELQALEEINANLPTNSFQSDVIDTTGWAILTLNIKQIWFNKILSGEKKVEYRSLKENKLSSFTWIDKNDGKRYLRKFDALKLYVGYYKDRDSALVEVIDTKYNSDERVVEYYLGKILEIKVTDSDKNKHIS
ncbi:MAG: GIY-YIG nuclease family protein [Bacteroidales bacterium]|nr:GIY-YIG nuclease family protein [Bacteroidales bacterium]